MKALIRLLSACLCIIALIMCASCSAKPEVTIAPTHATQPSPTEPATDPESTIPTPAERYHEAANATSALSGYTLQVATSQNTTVGVETYWITTEQTIHSTDNGSVLSQEQVRNVGSHSVTLSQYIRNGKLYLELDGNKFSGPLPDGYLSHFVPAVLMDTKFYDTVAVSTADENQFLFTGATAGESWAMPEDALLLEAEGSAKVENGYVAESEYRISYQYGAAVITLEVQTTLDPTTPEIPTIENKADYLPIAHPDAVVHLEEAYGNLISAGVVSATNTDSITCQASSIYRNQTTVLNTYNQTDTKLASVDTSVSLINYSKNNETSTYLQTEKFIDGMYSITVNNGETEQIDTVTARDMQIYCQDFLVSTVLKPEHIADARMTELNGIYLMEFTGNAELAEIMCQNACTTLYENPYLLSQLATSEEVNSITAYLAFDKYTGLPTAAGISLIQTHNIEDYPYVLQYQLDQSYTLASLEAYETVTGKPLPTDSSLPIVQPLLYRITNEEGKNLWLMGTIHVGDNRTSSLPTAVIDALYGSDALAVEFDIETFTQLSKTDTVLQEQLASVCYYMDGTTLEDHLDTETYALAIQYAKACGLYNNMTALIKPVILENAISSFFLSQGYALSPQNGVDIRLINLANEKNITVLEVESADEQFSMLTGLSDEAQSYLLQSLFETGAMESYIQTDELFTLWCNGDEAQLSSYLNDSLAATDDASEAVVQELLNAVYIDREANMAKKAVEYLNGDQTVFMAVGLAHLLRDGGLLDLLRQDGYTVEVYREVT